MKLRIRGNSLRLRLTKSEVEKFGGSGIVIHSVSFTADDDQDLSYSIVSSLKAAQVTAHFKNGNITILVPQKTADSWTQTEQVGFEAKQELSEEKHLFILIEKDFVCLTDRQDEDESDNYPHPNSEQSN